MRRQTLGIGLALLAAIGSLGCFQARYSYDGPKLLTTGPSLGTEAEVVRHFRTHDRQFYLLVGLLPIGEPANGAEMAAREVGDHDGVVNLVLADGQDVVDMLFSNLVCGLGIICGSWSVWAEGDVVQIKGPRQEVWVAPQTAPEAAPEGALAEADEEGEAQHAAEPSLPGILPAKQETP